jgi:hypothetical protein
VKELVDWQQTSWQEAEAILARVTDQMGQRIDAGILAPVVGLNLLGFRTSASCEGHLSWGCPYPWIEFYQDVADPDYEQAVEIASRPDLTPQDQLTARNQLEAHLTRFVQHDSLYQALGALLADYLATKPARNPEGNQMTILLAPFAPSRYRLLAAEPSWWQRWDERERMEQTDWWEQIPLHERQSKLLCAQAEMAAFAAFLKARILTRPSGLFSFPLL